MKEYPAKPHALDPFVNSSLNPIHIGMEKGITIAVCLTTVYAPLTALMMFVDGSGLPIPETLQDGNAVAGAIIKNYIALLGMGVWIFFIGVILAGLWGYIGGGLIGAIFRYGIKWQLPRAQALLFGFTLSIIMLVVRLWLTKQYSFDAYIFTSFYGWIGFILPNIGAFLGQWWVAHQVNKLMPVAWR